MRVQLRHGLVQRRFVAMVFYDIVGQRQALRATGLAFDHASRQGLIDVVAPDQPVELHGLGRVDHQHAVHPAVVREVSASSGIASRQ